MNKYCMQLACVIPARVLTTSKEPMPSFSRDLQCMQFHNVPTSAESQDLLGSDEYIFTTIWELHNL